MSQQKQELLPPSACMLIRDTEWIVRQVDRTSAMEWQVTHDRYAQELPQAKIYVATRNVFGIDAQIGHRSSFHSNRFPIARPRPGRWLLEHPHERF
ncbi:MAG: hypothetical protein ACREXX_23310 [Gammaproteobacteria bacterium]